MNIIIIMIPLSFLILLGAVGAFFWAVNNDQFDDMDSPGLMPLSDECDDDSLNTQDNVEKTCSEVIKNVTNTKKQMAKKGD
jgi:cbb3-type cytochrome oxidase maturation protein